MATQEHGAPETGRSTVVIKAKCGTDCRRFEIAPTMSLAELREQLYVIYELPKDESDQLKYVDEEGDLVTLIENTDFQRVIATTLNEKKALRVVLLSRYRKTVTFKEPLKSHNQGGKVTPPRSTGGLSLLAEDESAMNANGDLWSVGQDHHLLHQCRDEEILAMLRDISFYIQSREGGGSPNFIRSAVKNRKRLITPGALSKLMNMNRDSVVEDDDIVENEPPQTTEQSPNRASNSNVAAAHTSSPARKRTPRPWPRGGDAGMAWGLQDVADWLHDQGYSDLVLLFQDNEIDGEVLEALDHEALVSMGMKVAGKRIKLLKDIRLLTSNQDGASKQSPPSSELH